MDNPGYYQSLPSLLSYNRGEAKAASFRSWKMRWGLGTGGRSPFYEDKKSQKIFDFTKDNAFANLSLICWRMVGSRRRLYKAEAASIMTVTAQSDGEGHYWPRTTHSSNIKSCI